LNSLAVFRKHHRAALPILPFAANSIHVDADVVLTSSSGWAHGFKTDGRKLVHCHSPARWLYLSDMYLGEDSGLLKRAVLAATSGRLRAWDRRAALSCDRYMAVSTVVQGRIADAYGISADVLFSPVAMSRDAATEPIPQLLQWLSADGESDPEGAFYLCVSRLLPYKNVDAVVGAFAGRPQRLVVVGRGPDADRIAAAKTPNVLMLSDLTDGQMSWLYQNCRALMAASHEDYGLTPIEAGVWGKPSIVLRWGGFLDTVEEGITGMYFDEPEAAAIADALDRFEMASFDPDKVRRHFDQFTEERYAEALYEAVDELAGRPR
jgi:glycosyltransferase involved in cell wall biosynthesis